MKLLSSMKLMIVLLTLFTLAIAVATFIENDYGATASRALIYDSVWFLILWILILINLSAVILRSQWWRSGRWMTLMFHLSILIILIGAGMTRWFGHEGTVHIREGDRSDLLLSDRAYIQVEADGIGAEKALMMSPVTRQTFQIEAGGMTVRFGDFIPRALKEAVPDESGEPLLSLILSRGRRSRAAVLRTGESADFYGYGLAFEGTGDVAIVLRQGQPVLLTKLDVTISSMMGGRGEAADASEGLSLKPMTVYRLGDRSLVMKSFLESGRIRARASEPGRDMDQDRPDALIVRVEQGGEARNLSLFGGEGVEPEPVTVNLGGSEITLKYGSKARQLPFALECVDFEIGRYPGSMRPSSFASEVIIHDEERDVTRPYRIFMNHILKYRGYRFFQAAYDDDEKGTILSASFDPGTPVVYFGFFLMSAGLILHLFSKKSRFRKLAGTVTGLLLLVSATGLQGGTPEEDHIQKFSRLLVQDGGRVKPVSSLAVETLWSITEGRTVNDLSGDDLLRMAAEPDVWKSAPVIPVKNSSVKGRIGLFYQARFAAYEDFFDKETGEPRLRQVLREIQSRPRGQRTPEDRELLRIDRALKLMDRIFDGSLFALFPDTREGMTHWFSPAGGMRISSDQMEEIKGLWTGYLAAVREGMDGGEWTGADEALSEIVRYQNTHGHTIIPPASRISAERLYHRLDLFKRLTWPFWILGALLSAAGLLLVVKPSDTLNRIKSVLHGLLWVGFLVQTAGLILRWIASAHAPWSNKYESMIFIGWSVMMAGLALSKKKALPLAAASLLTALILQVSHLPWMNPKLALLPPVLKSKWLIIHVSVITSSYGFFGVGAVLALITLFLFIVFDRKKDCPCVPEIRSLSAITERMLIIGLVLVSIGNLFGAVWANESWGRYWGWDPKETWTLVIVAVYTGVLHFRLIPGLKSLYAFNVGGLLAVWSVFMTYFGVNFYLSGMHSYAGGDPVPVPAFVYITFIVMGAVIGAAFMKRKLP